MAVRVRAMILVMNAKAIDRGSKEMPRNQRDSARAAFFSPMLDLQSPSENGSRKIAVENP
jgi:hypothetical protein